MDILSLVPTLELCVLSTSFSLPMSYMFKTSLLILFLYLIVLFSLNMNWVFFLLLSVLYRTPKPKTRLVQLTLLLVYVFNNFDHQSTILICTVKITISGIIQWNIPQMEDERF